jgi:hypothetical protein
MSARGLAIATGAAVVLSTGCGESTMSVDEFVSAVEEQGVHLELTDDELVTTEEGKELYGLELEPFPHGESGEEHGSHAHGSLAVYDEVSAADAGLESCQGAADLLCYQAGNVVVVLESGGLEAQRLAAAIRGLAEEE